MEAKRERERLLYSLLVGVLMLEVLPMSSQQLDSFEKWVALQQTSGDKNTVEQKLDAAVVSAEAGRVEKTSVDPTNTFFGPDDGFYKTIAEAIATIPDNSKQRYVIKLKPGYVFHEKVFLGQSKPFVTFKSEPTNPAVVVWNDTATTPGTDGKPLGIDNSSTVSIESDYFIGYGIIFKNDATPTNAQAPALRLAGSKAIIFNCTIDGGHGSLYDQKGLHYFKASVIKGTIDFIFGFARSLYEECMIISMNEKIGDVPTAQKQETSETTVKGDIGFSYKNCTIKGEEGKKIYLGRSCERAIYSLSEMGSEVVPIVWDGVNIQKAQSGIYYGEFMCHGAGSDLSKKAGWALSLTEAQAKPFLDINFVSGGSWIIPLPPSKE
ncbi:hypothetical protein ACP4OV_002156 [Aristida adscensionis]